MTVVPRPSAGPRSRAGDTLLIRISIKTPTPSAGGKTLVVASTRGNQKTAVYAEPKAPR